MVVQYNMLLCEDNRAYLGAWASAIYIVPINSVVLLSMFNLDGPIREPPMQLSL